MSKRGAKTTKCAHPHKAFDSAAVEHEDPDAHSDSLDTPSGLRQESLACISPYPFRTLASEFLSPCVLPGRIDNSVREVQ